MTGNNLKKGVALSYISLLLQNVITVLYTPFMLHKLGQSEYGLYSLVASILTYLNIMDFGIGNAIVRFTAEFREKKSREELSSLFGMFFVIYLIISVLVIISGTILYFNLPHMFSETLSAKEISDAETMFLILLLNLVLTFMFSIFTSIITAYEKFVFQKTLNILRIILQPALIIAVLLYGYKAVAMVAVMASLNIILLFINMFYCFRKLNIKISFHNFQYSLLGSIFSYSFFIFLEIIVNRIWWNSGHFILATYIGTATVAVFAIAMQIKDIFTSFSVAATSLFLPRVTIMTVGNSSSNEISELFIKVGRIQYAVMIFIFSGFIVFGKSFISLWAGKDYLQAYDIALIVMFPLMVPLVQNLGIIILQAKNQIKFRSISYLIISLLGIGISIPLAQRYGGLGCAVATAISLIAGNILIMNIYYYLKADINIPKFWKEILKMSSVPFAATVIAYFIIQKTNPDSVIKLITSIAVFSVLYLPLFFYLSLNKYEKRLFTDFFKKIFLIKQR